MSDIIEVFKARRSVRAYTDEQIPDELLRRIMRDWGPHDKYVPPLFAD